MNNIGKQVKILKYGGMIYWDKIGVIMHEYSSFFGVKMPDGVIISPNKPDSTDPQCDWVTELQQLPIFN